MGSRCRGYTFITYFYFRTTNSLFRILFYYISKSLKIEDETIEDEDETIAANYEKKLKIVSHEK